jgi:hypothetical protein
MHAHPAVPYAERVMSIGPIPSLLITPPSADPSSTAITISRTYGFAATVVPVALPASYPPINPDPQSVTRVTAVSPFARAQEFPDHLVDEYA